MVQIDPKLLQKLKKQVQLEIAQKERECIEYWMSQVEKIYKRGHQSLPEMQMELRQLIEKMRNRIEVIRTRGY